MFIHVLVLRIIGCETISQRVLAPSYTMSRESKSRSISSPELEVNAGIMEVAV